ncbi:nucleotide exchange factor GrpE [Anaeromyxobacter sp. Red801]|uniref:nucleotide exchange factor GrpE n=1 Tax=Anaeromyxobacter sp. Red801 TaxID=3411632 RepID=UPI003BA33CC8
MADERRDASAPGAEGQVKVVDRRRFRQDGEPIAPPGAGAPQDEEGGPALGAAAEARLAEQAARIDELTRAYAALVEDNKAFRQRLERERTRVVDAERAGVAQTLLEATDDLERALAAASAPGEPTDERLGHLIEGVRLSLSVLHQRIGALGAERIATLGQPFDPHVAEAVDTVAVGDPSQDGVVVQEIRAGYRVGDRVLRPARVRVGKVARA